jgi:hypothetical protein
MGSIVEQSNPTEIVEKYTFLQICPKVNTIVELLGEEILCLMSA